MAKLFTVLFFGTKIIMTKQEVMQYAMPLMYPPCLLTYLLSKILLSHLLWKGSRRKTPDFLPHFGRQTAQTKISWTIKSGQ